MAIPCWFTYLFWATAFVASCLLGSYSLKVFAFRWKTNPSRIEITKGGSTLLGRFSAGVLSGALPVTLGQHCGSLPAVVAVPLDTRPGWTLCLGSWRS